MADRPEEFTKDQVIEFKKTFASMSAAIPDDYLRQITSIVPPGTSAYFIVDAICTWPHDPFVKKLIEQHQESTPKKERILAELYGITHNPNVLQKDKLAAYKLMAEIMGWVGKDSGSGSNKALVKDDQLEELSKMVTGV